MTGWFNTAQTQTVKIAQTVITSIADVAEDFIYIREFPAGQLMLTMTDIIYFPF
jgi:hypothetical protein